MHCSSRRDFLKTAALLPVAASVGGLTASSVLAAVEPPKRVGGPLLKISCNAYSFAKLLNDQLQGRGKGMSLFDLAEFCAEHNFDGMDPTGYYFPGYEKNGTGVPTDKFIFELKKRCFELGLGISGTGVGNNFTTAAKAARANDVQRIKNWAEVAGKLGAPVLRVFADTQMRAQTWETVSNGASRDQVQEWIAAALRECSEHAKKFGVKIGVQNHGDFLKTGQELLALVKVVNSDACGPIVDT